MLVAAAAVLAGVIAVALGRGGELAFFPADYAPLKLDEISATDVVLLRPPMALWGYSTQATDEALNRIAEALTERDIEITALRQRVANLEAASPEGRRRIYGVPGRPGGSGPSPRSSGPLPRAVPPGGPGRDPRSSGPLRAGGPPGGPGAGPRSSGPLPQAAPAGPPGPGAGDVRASGPHARVGP